MADERNAARFVLKALLLGKDPETGRDLHRGEVVHRPEVMRALQVALDALTAPGERGAAAKAKPLGRNDRREKQPDRAGLGWDRAEDDGLRALFGQRRTIRDIATELGRTKGAVTARLEKLGLAEKRPEA